MLPAQINFQSADLNMVDLCIPIGVSLAASVIVYLMYHLFYGSRTIGQGLTAVLYSAARQLPRCF